MSINYEDILREAAQPVQPILSPGAQYADSQRLFQGIPAIECSPGGRLWATWYAGGQGESPLNYILLATSDDGDKWSAPILAIDPPGHVRAFDSNVWLDPQGRLWLFWTQTHTLHDGRWGVWAITTDQPNVAKPKWSEPRRLADGIMLNKPVVLDNGDWLLPISHQTTKVLKNEVRMLPSFLRQHVFDAMTPEQKQAVDDRQGAYAYVSRDEGNTFEPLGRAQTPMKDVAHNEHMIVQLSDGSLLMYLRTAYGIGMSTSTDGGKQWSDVVPSGLPHTSSRFFLRKLQSGAILLVKHGPLALPDESDSRIQRDQLTAYLSHNDGNSWQGGLLIESRPCTYPDGTQTADGNIYITYDRGRRAEKEILYTRFSEQDVLDGCFASECSRQGALINRATGVISDDEDWKHLKGRDDSEELRFTGI